MAQHHRHHCICGLKDQLAKFKAGKLGLLGGIFIIGHLLFHVAECLILPAIFLAVNSNAAETSDLSRTEEMVDTETAFSVPFPSNYRNLTGFDVSQISCFIDKNLP